jgi:hypothetical protein
MRTRAYRRFVRSRQRTRHLRFWYSRWGINAGDPPPRDIAIRHPGDCGHSHCGICRDWDRPSRVRERREAFAWEWVAAEGWGLDSDA